MKKFSFTLLAIALLTSSKLNAQCIKDIQNLIDMPEPCFFIGMIDYDNPECFEYSTDAQFKYNWIISSADDGKYIASYQGIAFQHTFEKFGGYEFCLEIDKDGDYIPEVVDCVTYTTCQICTGDSLKLEYKQCPYGAGCDMTLSTHVAAENAYGLKPTGKFVVTYLPTPQELAGGEESFELEFGDIDVEFDSQKDSILAIQDITVPYRRGCYIPRFEFKLLDGYGAHGWDGTACTEIVLRSDEKFRCIACANEDGDCIASIVASKISNEEGTCNLFLACNTFREDGNSADTESHHERFIISPNPASESIHIDLPPSNNEHHKLVIMNQIGQSVAIQEIPFDAIHMDVSVSLLSPGIYLVNLMENNRISHSSRVIVVWR